MVDGVWMSESALVFVILCAWLAVCAWFDWRKGEVPNWLTLPGMAGASCTLRYYVPNGCC
jgi:Flp pilus assembly protein protease CpaA